MCSIQVFLLQHEVTHRAHQRRPLIKLLALIHQTMWFMQREANFLPRFEVTNTSWNCFPGSYTYMSKFKKKKPYIVGELNLIYHNIIILLTSLCSLLTGWGLHGVSHQHTEHTPGCIRQPGCTAQTEKLKK